MNMLVRQSLLATIACFAFASLAFAQDVNWSANDLRDAKVSVPAADRPSLLCFVRPDQQQSQQVLEQIRALAGEPIQIVLIVSGEDSRAQADALAASGKYPCSIIADGDFKSSGQLNVHVWPTTIIVGRSGAQAGRLAGLNDSFTSDLRACLDFAAGKIDQPTLEKRLASHAVVTQATTQMADSYLQVARRLIESGDLEQARSQVEQALKLQPDSAGVKLALARILALQDHPADAMRVLDTLKEGSVAPSQLAVIRARALIGMEKWDDARRALEQTLPLNPEPAEGLYLLGLVQQHQKDFASAAESFRKAYESLEKH